MHHTKPGWLQVVKKLAPDNAPHQAMLVASGLEVMVTTLTRSIRYTPYRL